MTSTFDPDFDGAFHRRRKRLPRWSGPAVLGLIVLAGLAVFVLRGPQIGVREDRARIINVVLPPPPPPPPPPPEPRPPEPKPVITPPQPTPQTPPPPAQTPPQAAPDASALTARQGAGPSDYGLQQGDGGGTRIGGKPAGDSGAFLAYADLVMADIRKATQSDPKLAAGRYSVKLAVQVDAEGRITGLRLLSGSGDAKRDAALQQRLAGLQLSRRPPDGLPVMRIQLDTTAGA